MALPKAPAIGSPPLERWQEAPADILPEQLLTSSAEAYLNRYPQMEETRFKTGPITVVHAFWLAGMSCDGCSVAVTGATNPSVESLLTGSVAALPKLILHHPVLSVEAGHEFVRNFELAAEGKLDAPYVVIFEGSVADETIAGKSGGYWSGMGMREVNDQMQMISTAEWLRRLAPGAAATIAIGTCATWGGIPAAVGNVTNSMGVMDFLGAEYRSDLGLPVVNRSIVTVFGPVIMKKGSLPIIMAIRNVWWRLAVGDQSCNVILPPGGRLIMWAAV
jgi:Ni,Fe-hydrogenase I small subunit